MNFSKKHHVAFNDGKCGCTCFGEHARMQIHVYTGKAHTNQRMSTLRYVFWHETNSTRTCTRCVGSRENKKKTDSPFPLLMCRGICTCVWMNTYVQRHMRMNEYLRAKAHAYEWMLTCKGTCVWMRKILMCRGTCIWMNSMRIGLPRRPISTVNLISGEITGWEEPVTGSIWETACTHIQGKEPSHGT